MPQINEKRQTWMYMSRMRRLMSTTHCNTLQHTEHALLSIATHALPLLHYVSDANFVVWQPRSVACFRGDSTPLPSQGGFIF